MIERNFGSLSLAIDVGNLKLTQICVKKCFLVSFAKKRLLEDRKELWMSSLVSNKRLLDDGKDVGNLKLTQMCVKKCFLVSCSKKRLLEDRK
jgi:hypothetical protein